MVCLCCIRINLSELGTVHIHELEEIELGSVYCKLAVLAISNLTDEDCVRIIESILSLNEDRTITVVEEFLLVDIDLCIKTVTE